MVAKMAARVAYAAPQIGGSFTAADARIQLTNIARAIPPTVTRTLTVGRAIAATDDTILVDTTDGPITVPLLPANQVMWLPVRIKNIGTHLATITGTVDGIVNPVLGPGQSITVQSDGEAWWCLGGCGVVLGDLEVTGNGQVDGNLVVSGTLTATVLSIGSVSLLSTGPAAYAGSFTLVAGVATVATTAMSATAILGMTRRTLGGNPGSYTTYTRVAGTSFTVTSHLTVGATWGEVDVAGTATDDTSTFDWWILETH